MRIVAQSLLVFIDIYKSGASGAVFAFGRSFCAEGLVRLGALKSVNFLILLQSLV